MAKPELIVTMDCGTRDLSVIVAAERLANGDLVILDMVSVQPPTIDRAYFETEPVKLLPRQEPWYRKFDKRKRR